MARRKSTNNDVDDSTGNGRTLKIENAAVSRTILLLHGCWPFVNSFIPRRAVASSCLCACTLLCVSNKVRTSIAEAVGVAREASREHLL